MLMQYAKFFINGGLLGLVAWALQLFFYQVIGKDTNYAYAMASCLTYAPLVVVNFLIQKSFIFKKNGLFIRFFVANIAVMLLVIALSEVCKHFLSLAFGAAWGERGGFMAAALLGSIPSFFIKKYWVFGSGVGLPK